MAVRVLVADDQREVLEALALLVGADPDLELVGQAQDAEEAIALAVHLRPDVALLDVKMPKGGGQRAAREIALRSPATRVVALSAYEDRSSVLEMLRAGAVGYLVKGATGQEVREMIVRCARGGLVLGPRSSPRWCGK